MTSLETDLIGIGCQKDQKLVEFVMNKVILMSYLHSIKSENWEKIDLINCLEIISQK